MANNEKCPGAGKCHGCMDWCASCGCVRHVCDTRLRGERCDEHPVPSPWSVIHSARVAAERQIAEGRRLSMEGTAALGEAADLESARRAYDRQMAEQERADMLPT